MASSEKPLSSCPLYLATTLRSSVVLKQVPTMEQYRCAASSQSLRRCLAGIAPGGPCDTVSTTHGLDRGIDTCEGTVVILRSEGEARPQAFVSRPGCL